MPNKGSPSSDKTDAIASALARLRASIEKPPIAPSPPPKPLPRDSLIWNAPDSQERYFMSHESRGIAVIINNKNFTPGLGLTVRTGTDVDAEELEDAFLTLGFSKNCIFRFDDVSCGDMLKMMKYYAAFNYENMDCCMVAILSHGKEGLIFGRDGKVALESLLEPFKTKMHQSLVGKPKIFLIQACRGEKLEDGVELISTDDQHVQRIPLEADFLYAYSTVPGYFSWRNAMKGSWFIQALAKKVKENKRNADMDFVRLLTRVNYEVAYQFQSNVPENPKMHLRKQMPSIVSMLTKDIFFYQPS